VTASTTVGSDAVLSFLGFEGVTATIQTDASSPDSLAVSQDGARIFVTDYDGVHAVSMSGYTPT
jgi:DNA-binding beta-propeller fold protein YncE